MIVIAVGLAAVGCGIVIAALLIVGHQSEERNRRRPGLYGRNWGRPR